MGRADLQGHLPVVSGGPEVDHVQGQDLVEGPQHGPVVRKVLFRALLQHHIPLSKHSQTTNNDAPPPAKLPVDAWWIPLRSRTSDAQAQACFEHREDA